METLLLYIGFIGMLLGAIYFGVLGASAPQGSRYFFIITTIIAGTAAVMYLTMATGDTVTELADGRTFYWGRYVDWVITTPLLLLDLALLALVSARQNIGLILGLIVLDLFMILTGLAAGAVTQPVGRGILFVISTVSMIVLLYLIVSQLFAAARSQVQSVQAIFNTLATLTIVLWSLYPVVWLLGTEGFGAVSPGLEVLLFLILDLLAKVGFGYLLLTNRQALTDVGGSVQAQPSRVQ